MTTDINIDDFYTLFFHGSNKLLEQYRHIQSSKLSKRLDLFTKLAISRCGSIDNITPSDGTPLESPSDIVKIQRLIDHKSFIIVPAQDEKTQQITHVFTVGMWYYWGIPDVIIRFNPYIDNDFGFIQILLNIVHDQIFDKFKEKIIDQKTDLKINRLDFKNDYSKFSIEDDSLDIKLNLNIVDESEYLSLKAMPMMWFYMYFMDADVDKDGIPKFYPLYMTDITPNQYKQISTFATTKLTDKLILLAQTEDIGELTDSESELEEERKTDDIEICD